MSALFLMNFLGLPKLLPSLRTSPESGSKALSGTFRGLSGVESPLCLCPAGGPSITAHSLWPLVQALAPTRVTWRTWATLTWWKVTRGGCASTPSGGPLGTMGPWKTFALSLTGIWTWALSTLGGSCEYLPAVIWASAPGNVQSLRDTLYLGGFLVATSYPSQWAYEAKLVFRFYWTDEDSEAKEMEWFPLGHKPNSNPIHVSGPRMCEAVEIQVWTRWLGIFGLGPQNKSVQPEEAGFSPIPYLCFWCSPATLLSQSHGTWCNSFPAAVLTEPFSALIPHSPVVELVRVYLSSVYMLSSTKAGCAVFISFLQIVSYALWRLIRC